MTFNLIILALLWLAYFILHSTLASLHAKRWFASKFPRFTPAYRLAYNVLAIALLIPPLWMMWSMDWPSLWMWSGIWQWLATGLALLAISGFLWSLRYYSGADFLGLEQLQHQVRTADTQGPFTISPLHRFVRHPWYFFGLVIIWTRDMDAAFLLTATLITLYFIIGSHLEENKLIQHYGDAYRRYQQLVPGLVPLPWRFLDKETQQQLLQLSRK